jgi:hypothetical protein
MIEYFEKGSQNPSNSTKLASCNLFLCASKMRFCGLDLEILYACLKNSFARNLPRDAQLQDFHSRTESVAGSQKKKIPIGFQTAQRKKKTLRTRIFGV